MVASKVEGLSKAVRQNNPQLFAALALHRTHKGRKLDFEHSPSLRALYADQRPRGCVIKSTQGGVSEWLLVKGIGSASAARNVFWVLPTYSLVGRFVRERFDRTMSMTPGYQRLVTDVDTGKFADSVSMKQFGNGTIAFVGSNTAAAFTEFPADTLIVDELDQCDQANVGMAWERLSASEKPEEWYISNPTITSYGVDEKYAESTQGRWYVRCKCGSWEHPQVIGNVLRKVSVNDYLVMDPEYDPRGVKDCRVMCSKCGKPINARGEGEWIEAYPKRDMAGYHYNKLFTARVPVKTLIERFGDSEGDETKRQRVWNADFGLAYDAPGAKITRDDILGATGEHRLGDVLPGASVVGIDVGSQFHIVAGYVGVGATPLRVTMIKSVRDKDEVLDEVRRLDPRMLVIDALPETRAAREIARSTKGGHTCYFGGKKYETVARGTVTVDRTSLLDSVKGAIVTKSAQFPIGIEGMEEFLDHLVASTRIFNPDANGGEGAYNWIEGSKPDHFFLALAYMVLAARMLITAGGR